MKLRTLILSSDYVGGPLTSFLYGSPLLKQGLGTGLVSCVLRNPPEWKSVDQFLAEYLLMYNRQLIQTHFGVKLSKETPEAETFGLGAGMYPLIPYYLWEKSATKSAGLASLMSRPALFKWLQAHFLKICLPHPRPQASMTLVYAPLNLTNFLRLLCHVASLGYPAHWLSTLIDSICSGDMSTTARAPRKQVLAPSDVDKTYPSRTMSVAPWTAEFTTLVAVWQAFLPFGLLTKTPLPAPDAIAEYCIGLPGFSASNLHVPHFMLVFWNQKSVGQPPRNLRPFLLDDETGDSSERAKKIRAEGVHALTTFNWSSETNAATFWLRVDVVDRMIREDWKVYIWRTDTWDSLTDGWLWSDVSLQQRRWP